jgi:CheY-like chemotaxis protein
MHILLVEDNPDDAHLAMIEFEDAGITVPVTLVEDGEAALQYLRCEPPYETHPRPTLVLLDLHLPKIDGHEVLQEVDGDDTLADIPIIVVSVPTELTWVKEEFSHVISGVLPKPIEVHELRMVLAAIPSLGPDVLT